MSNADENQPANELSGRGFFGWLGRQVGHIKRAIHTDVEKTRVYRNESTEEQKLPADPNVTFRRTTIDEVIVDRRPPTDDE